MRRSHTESGILESIEKRGRTIAKSKELLGTTRDIIERLGSAIFQPMKAELQALFESMSAETVYMVLVGEFSRGKSALANALLNMRLLPSAMEATTSVNTWIRPLPEGRSERFIRIHWRDETECNEIAWDSDETLKKWGTELDKTNRENRNRIAYIECFTDHPLIGAGLVVIDTPGLESVMKEHDDITREAIEKAHIAIWLLSTDQLGGNAKEWKFLRSLRSHFRKFVTVINKWDLVLRPNDDDDKRKTEEIRCREKLDKLREIFRQELGGDPGSEILIDERHLFPVSALWALDGSDVEKQKSGIVELSRRLSEMLESGEAMNEIIGKPLHRLHEILNSLVEQIESERSELDNPAKLEEREQEIRLLESEIKNLEMEMKHLAQESKDEHRNAKECLTRELHDEITTPVKELKDQVDEQVTEQYVRELIEKGAPAIDLPHELKEDFSILGKTIQEKINKFMEKVVVVLDALHKDFGTKFEKHFRHSIADLKAMRISLALPDFDMGIDLSNIQEHMRKRQELEARTAYLDDQIEKADLAIAKDPQNQQKLEMAKHDLESVRRQIEMLGPPPPVRQWTEKKLVKRGFRFIFQWTDDVYEDVERVDDKCHRKWEKRVDKLEEKMANEEERIREIIEEEERTNNRRISELAARKKAEREKRQCEEEIRKAEEKLSMEIDALAKSAFRRLHRKTSGALASQIKMFETSVAESIGSAFDNQLELLCKYVEGKFMDPLKAKQEQKQRASELLSEGHEAVEKRKALLHDAMNEVRTIIAQAIATESSIKGAPAHE
jgi:GTPase SAR1 family protein